MQLPTDAPENGFESMNHVSTALAGGHDDEFQTRSNTKINLGSIPQKEENTVFIGEGTAKGLWCVQG